MGRVSHALGGGGGSKRGREDAGVPKDYPALAGHPEPVGRAIPRRVGRISLAPETVSPDRVYPAFGIYGFARGLFDKSPHSGAEISATTLFRVRAGQFGYSKLKAFEGAFGLVPASLDGRYVTNEFPSFDCLPDRLLPEYLWAYFRREETWRSAAQLSAGVGARRERLHPDEFVGLTIPLPSLDEQRRIVARVDAVATRLAEARRLREEIEVAAGVIFSVVLSAKLQGTTSVGQKPIGELVELVSGQVDPRKEPYNSLPLISGDSIVSGCCKLLATYRTAEADEAISGKYHFPAGTVLYSKLRPYLRKATYVPFEALCSADIYAFASIASDLDPRFFMYSLVSEQFTTYANRVSGRTRMPKLNQSQLFGFVLAYPALTEQRRIVAHLDALQSKLDAVRALQSETAGALARFPLGPGLMCLVGGQPGAGKTALANQLAFDAVRLNADLKALVTCCEMPPNVLLDRQVSRLSGVPYKAIRERNLEKKYHADVKAGQATIAQIRDRVTFHTGPFDLMSLIESADGCDADLLVIDYLQRLTVPGPQRDKRTTTNAVLESFREFAAGGRGLLILSSVGRQPSPTAVVATTVPTRSYGGGERCQDDRRLCCG